MSNTQTLIGVALVVALVGAAGGCKKLDTFSDAAPVDISTMDSFLPADTGPPADTSPPADAGPDAIQVPATWITRLGDPATVQLVGLDIGLDASGNVYISAWLWGVVTIGQTTLGADDLESQAVVKLDPLGKPLWARQVSPADMHSASGVLVGPGANLGFALDPASGSSYVVGTFSGSITIGTTQLTSAGKKDVYVAKLDKDGTWLWAVSGGGSEDDIAHAVTLNGYGPVVAGDFQGTASFGSKSLTSQGGPDIFLAQLDYTNGSCVSVLAAGSSNPMVDNGSELDAETAWVVTSGTADVYVAGQVKAGASFGSAGTLTGQFVAGADLNAVGALTWSWARAPLRTTWSLTLDRTSGDLLAGSGGSSFAVAAIDGQTGEDLWVFPTSSPSPNSYAFAVAHDPTGYVYAGGRFSGTLILAPFGHNNLTAAGPYDGFVLKLDKQRRLHRTWHISSPVWGWVVGLATGPDGAVYATGGFAGQTTFDGKTVTGQASQRDGFVWKLPP